jgi:hypothetical protein
MPPAVATPAMSHIGHVPPAAAAHAKGISRFKKTMLPISAKHKGS